MKIKSLPPSYEVTLDIKAAYSSYLPTANQREMLEKLLLLTDSTTEKSKQILINHAEMFPGLPQIKCYLSIWYKKRGMYERSEAISREVVAQHPEFLFAYLQLASFYFESGDFDKLISLFGREFRLEKVIRSRRKVSAHEYVIFQSIAAQYFAHTNQREEMLRRLDQIEKWDLSGNNIATTISSIASQHPNMLSQDDWWHFRIAIPRDDIAGDISKIGNYYIHPEISALYLNGLDIDTAVYDDILKLPDNVLIYDLRRVLIDSIRSMSNSEISDQEEESNGRYLPDKHTSFPLHAMNLIREMDYAPGTDVVEEILRQDDNYYDRYYSKVSILELGELIIGLVEDEITELIPLLHEEQVADWAKVALLAAMNIYTYGVTDFRPKYRKSLSRFIRDLVEREHLSQTRLDFFIPYSILFVNDLGTPSMLPWVKKLFMRSESYGQVPGKWAEVERAINFDNKNGRNKGRDESQLYSALELESSAFYRENFQDNENWDGHGIEDIVRRNYEKERDSPTPIVRLHAKVGRNDPCPCGSGKKYKKCCLDKDSA